MDRLHAAAVPVERFGGLLVDAAIPGVDDGVGVEGSRVGREFGVKRRRRCCLCFMSALLTLILKLKPNGVGAGFYAVFAVVVT